MSDEMFDEFETETEGNEIPEMANIDIKQDIATFISNVDIHNVSRKYHNKVIYDLTNMFKTARKVKGLGLIN